MENELSYSPQMAPHDVFAEIEAMKSRLMATGAFDDEPSQLDQIQTDLRRGVITPEQASLRARRIIESRSEYH